MTAPGDRLGDAAGGDSGNAVADATMLLAGTLTGAYGIKGWVKVHVLTDPAENFLTFGRWQLVCRGQRRAARFTDGRRQGRGLIARLAGVDDRRAAEALRGAEIWVESRLLPHLPHGDFYWHQLRGLQVWCQWRGEARLLGEVDHLIETGANDVLVLKPCAGSVDRRERLVPYLPRRVVQRVALQERRIDVDWHPED